MAAESEDNVNIYRRLPLWAIGFVVIISGLIMVETTFRVTVKVPMVQDEVGATEIFKDEMISTVENVLPKTMPTREEEQWHRRLKRIVQPNRERERELKAEQARERNQQANPSKKLVNDIDLGLPPPFALNDDNDQGILVFPNSDAEARYRTASKLWEDIGFRDKWDPLGTTNDFNRRNNETNTRVSFAPKVEYLGVLVDAGRHYFDVDWLKKLIVYLHRLRFNLIHFRLTDDQAFNVKLDSYPELAFPSKARSAKIQWGNSTQQDDIGANGGTSKKTQQKYSVQLVQHDKVYSPSELRELVAFAKDRGITMIPEINVPGHAASWAGIPGLVLNCPEFICASGYGVPLNVEHPHLKTILTAVLKEVLDIFDNPPLLHLGGDEVFLSSKCFEELGRDPFNYTDFETLLKEVLDDLGVSEDCVLRWEETGPRTLEDVKHPRTGNIEHYWLNLPAPKPNQKLPKLKEAIFVSHGLYFDTNHDNGAAHIYNRTLRAYELQSSKIYYPKGIVAGTFELGPDLWVQRNVAGRLIAVAMGAAQLKFSNSNDFWDAYNSTCRDTMGLQDTVCELQGFVAVAKLNYQQDWKRTWNDWVAGVCDRLTETSRRVNMARVAPGYAKISIEEANKYFWKTIKQPFQNRTRVVQHDKASRDAGKGRDNLPKSTIAGVLLDLVNSAQSTTRTIELLKKHVAPLGIGLAQLRLADNHGFAINLESLSRVSYSPLATLAKPLPKAQDFVTMVSEAAKLGIELYPEISLSTTAGGWVDAGFALNCAQAFCNTTSAARQIMANDVGRPGFLPVAYSAIRELMTIFSTSHYMSLGSDERKSHAACFREDGRYPLGVDIPLASFEKKLARLLKEFVGVTTQNILRWENEEGVHYPDRAGEITQYRSTTPFVLPSVRQGESYFVTLDLLAPPGKQQVDKNPLSYLYEIYQHTRQLVGLKPLGILAEIRTLEESIWIDYHVRLRLISFLLGTRPAVTDCSPAEFEEHLMKECDLAKFEECRDLRNIVLPNETVSYVVESDSFFKLMCDQQTVPEVSRRAKTFIV